MSEVSIFPQGVHLKHFKIYLDLTQLHRIFLNRRDLLLQMIHVDYKYGCLCSKPDVKDSM